MTSKHRDTIEHWVGDYCSSTAFRDAPTSVREYAPEILVTFLEAACAARDVEPADLEERDMKFGLIDGVARRELPESVREGVSELCASFLGTMQEHGRLSGGRQLGKMVRAMRATYADAASGKTKPIVNPSQRVGRNDPCPCGSGKKYKKCCHGTLG